MTVNKKTKILNLDKQGDSKHYESELDINYKPQIKQKPEENTDSKKDLQVKNSAELENVLDKTLELDNVLDTNSNTELDKTLEAELQAEIDADFEAELQAELDADLEAQLQARLRHSSDLGTDSSEFEDDIESDQDDNLNANQASNVSVQKKQINNYIEEESSDEDNDELTVSKHQAGTENELGEKRLREDYEFDPSKKVKHI